VNEAASGQRLARWTHGVWPGSSGPAVATLVHKLLALTFLDAWISLGTQIRVLIGPRGLMPLARFLEVVSAESEGSIPLLPYPSLLRFAALTGDAVLVAGTVIGVVLALLALAGLRPRLCFALGTVLYLSYAAACRTFLSFQWDNLLLECGFLAAFLPADRPAPVAHLLFRLVAFKLYFESGIAKWQSSLHDWQDGSAMTFYYETAPLPAALAFHAHNLPAWWHHFESRATLVLELVVPFAFFGPRPARLVAAGALTGFQIVNAATANYGFFCYLAAALHLFLLDDPDLARLPLPRWLRPPAPGRPALPLAAEIVRRLRFVGLGVFVLLSLMEAGVHFTEGGPWLTIVAPLRRLHEPLRLVNTYHLFGSITRERIEPEFQALVGVPQAAQEAGQEADWRPLDLWHKPGNPARRPDMVAPHQPRVDFQLWFYGLSFQGRQPLYVASLLRHLCDDRAAIQPLFREPLPPATAVRLAFYQYHFTTLPERRATGRYWTRTLIDAFAPIPCDR
jgi:hypothetical protein